MNIQMAIWLLAEAGGKASEATKGNPDSSGEGGTSVAWWDTAIDLVRQRGFELAMNILAALAIFIVGRWVAKLLTSIVRRIAGKAKVDETLQKFLANLVYSILLALVVLASLQRLGVDTTSFAAIIAAAGLAIGFALQGSLANFAAGVMLIIFKPFGVGDFVNAAGSSGTVEEIQIFNTIMKTGDNVRVILPNASITSGTITNFSANDTRRIDLTIGCGYGDDLKAVQAFLEEILAADERILKEPEAVVAVSELGDSSVDFVVRPWVAAGDYWAVRWDLTSAIKNGFDDRGFNIPYPTRDLNVHNAAS